MFDVGPRHALGRRSQGGACRINSFGLIFIRAPISDAASALCVWHALFVGRSVGGELLGVVGVRRSGSAIIIIAQGLFMVMVTTTSAWVEQASRVGFSGRDERRSVLVALPASPSILRNSICSILILVL